MTDTRLWTEEERELVRTLRLEGKPYKEIGDMLGRSKGAVARIVYEDFDRDFLREKEAHLLADRVREYWREKGKDVRVWVELQEDPALSRNYLYVVRSDIDVTK